MSDLDTAKFGGVAHLGERIVCNDEAAGSIPVTSTKAFVIGMADMLVLEASGREAVQVQVLSNAPIYELIV